MTREEAVAIYENCPKFQVSCEECPLNDKQYMGDICICALLSQAEARVWGLKEKHGNKP